MQNYEIKAYISGFKNIQTTTVKAEKIEDAIIQYKKDRDCYAAINIMSIKKVY